MDLPEIWCHIASFLDSDLSKDGKTIKQLVAEELGKAEITHEELVEYIMTPEWRKYTIDSLMTVAPALLEHVKNIANLRAVNKFFYKLLTPLHII